MVVGDFVEVVAVVGVAFKCFFFAKDVCLFMKKSFESSLVRVRILAYPVDDIEYTEYSTDCLIPSEDKQTVMN